MISEENVLEKALKQQKMWFWIALISSILAVVGIPMIPIFANAKIWWLMTVGIVFVAHGFYGLALYWMAYSNARRRVRLIYAITEENILTLDKLAAQISYGQKETDLMIKKLITDSYISGYYYENGTLIKREEEKKTRLVRAECPACGAPVDAGEGECVCEYCGTHFKVEVKLK